MAKTALAAVPAALFLTISAIPPGAAAQSEAGQDNAPGGEEAAARALSPERWRVQGRQVFIDMPVTVQAPGGETPGPFALCAEGACSPANVAVAGDRIVLSTRGTPDPDTVRYCWDGATDCTLAAADGAPVPPFELALD